MRVILRVCPFAPVPEVVEFAVRCEAAGFDGVGFLDSQMLAREVYVTLAQVASATTRLQVMPAVTNPMTRHVSALAAAVASVEDVGPGRLEVWIGRGHSSIDLAGLPVATVRQMREAVLSLRALLAGEWDALPGVHSRMSWSSYRTPIYIAASGPRTLRLAGEIADGVLLNVGVAPEALQRAQDASEAGARSAGRDPADVKITLALPTSIRENREDAVRWAGPLIMPHLDQPQWLREAGIDAKGVRVPAGLATLYPDPMHPDDPERAMSICDEVPYELRAQIGAAMGLVGTPEDAIARLKQLAAAGYESVFMRTVDTVTFPEAELAAYRDQIGPAVKALTAAR